ncbi:MAG: hypothetical protein QM673_10760 [Gordonia sp. (in: high G+C Gram-positive bacteria)]
MRPVPTTRRAATPRGAATPETRHRAVLLASRLSGVAFVVMNVVAAVALSSCSSAPVATVTSSAAATTNPNIFLQQRSEGVQRLLDGLTRSLLTGDQRRLRGLLDPTASAAFRSRWLAAATALSGGTAPQTVSADSTQRGQALRLKEFHYQLASTAQAETLAPADVQRRLDAQGSSDSWVAPVELRYALGGPSVPGADEPEIVVDLQLIVARYDDDWRLVGDQVLLGDPPPGPQLWDYPDPAATGVLSAGGLSVIVSYPGAARAVAALRAQLPAAVAAVARFWGERWPRRVVVVATGRPEEFTGLAATDPTDTREAAAATTFGSLDDQGRVAGQRIVLAPTAGELAPPVLDEVLRHELTHVATRAVTVADAPKWMTEGLAEYVGRKGTYVRLADAAPDLAALVRAGRPPTAVPADQDFVLSARSSSLAYQAAWSLAAFVAGRYGEVRLKALYRGVAASGDTGRQDAAIGTALGVTRAQMVTQWQHWLAEQVSG